MRKSRSETADTRKRIISVAAKMFLEKGIGSVGMRDIMSAADLTPGGFYRHFESKDQLVAEANIHAFQRLFAMLQAETAGISHARAVARIVAVYLSQTQAREKAYLCPLSTIGAEMSHSDPQVRAIAFSGYQDLCRLLADHFTGLSETRALALAGGIVSTMVGAVTLAEIAPDRRKASAALTGARRFIAQMLVTSNAFAKEKEEKAKI